MQDVVMTRIRKTTDVLRGFFDKDFREKLQGILEQYCKITGIAGCFIDENGKLMTTCFGEQSGIEVLEEFSRNQVITSTESWFIGKTEKLVLSTFKREWKIANIPIVIENNLSLNFLIVIPEKQINIDDSDENKCNYMQEFYYASLKLLQETVTILLQAEITLYLYREEQQESEEKERELVKQLKTAAATTQMVQLLDSNDPIEELMGKLLEIVGKHIGADLAQVIQVTSDGKWMEIIAENRKDSVCPASQKGLLPVYSFLQENKCIYPKQVMSSMEELEQEENGFPILASFPVMKQEMAGSIFLCLIRIQEKLPWDPEEVSFMEDSVKVLQSVLARRLQKNSLASSYEALESVLDNVICEIYVKDQENGKVLFANRRCRYTFAQELQEGTFDTLLDQGNKIGKGSELYEIHHAKHNRWYDMFYTEIKWVNGRRVSLYSLYDITDKKLNQKKIEQQACTDFLTGLYNRMCCERDLAWHIGEADKIHQTGALLYLDLDDFKHINDGLGHQYGDILLKSISHSFQKIEGIKNTCYRMGGDEFVIIVPPDYYGRLQEIIRNIRKIFNRPWYLKDADYYCTMSMGIVTFPDEGDSVTDLIKKADIAMYEAKRAGKNRVAKYSENIDSFSGRRLDMEKNMRDATAEGYKEFEVYFQPIICTTEEPSCSGAEALIRWNSTKLGFISPGEFIPLAEYLGLIIPIGNHVLWEACRRCRIWNDNGHPDYKVNVNLSVVQLLQADIVETIEMALQETKILPEHLTLEVTESLAINDMERMKGILGRIKKLGVKIALDDFGTGYSSLNHIREIPFDIIKVDQSFVHDLAKDTYSQSFIKLVSELAETIGVSICVEGIENQDQYQVLQGMKVRYIQGYYFDKPMSREDFEKKYVPGLVKSTEIV